MIDLSREQSPLRWLGHGPDSSATARSGTHPVGFSRYDGTILTTSLTKEQEEKLRAAPEHKHKEQRGGTSHAGATASDKPNGITLFTLRNGFGVLRRAPLCLRGDADAWSSDHAHWCDGFGSAREIGTGFRRLFFPLTLT